ncbi:MAG: 16S rRNA (adenine(1518)-N(6)/adenine(1519)-N(6))-dimethyltransferase RsmA [Clostridiales bacterium]|nr:16S rRNA (adenine(1518)-N(6)/adenine(1519)-N(6))-dimethyltransferase RsmA [Clostridiales bacterium]
MGSLTSPKVIKNIIERHGFKFSKSLGQNFLIDSNIVEKIIEGANISEEDNILEIGPGIGTLTKELVTKAGKVVAVEIDRGLLPILNETLGSPSNLTIVQGDILKLDIKRLVKDYFEGQDFKVVANLPYYITTPIIMRFLEEDLPFTALTVMVQKELAQRMAASPNSKEYGSLSVAVQYYTQPQLVCKVPSTVFMPRPKVDSLVITLNRLDHSPAEVKDEKLFFSIVRAAFAKRRKTLLNNLVAENLGDWDKAEITKILEEVGIDPQIRGESLGIKEYALIANRMGIRS